MTLAKIHIFCILISVALVCIIDAAKRDLERTSDESATEDEEAPSEDDRSENATEETSTSSDGDFGFLPPIILLDFENATDDNGNLTSEEKSKRTVNGDLAYGFQRNNFLSGKTNYYFPAGSSGTTVSIEESISPFLPRTIVENVPYNASGFATSSNLRISPTANYKIPSDYGSRYVSSPSRVQSFSTFGLRTKLRKPAIDNYNAFASNPGENSPREYFSPTPSPTSSSSSTVKTETSRQPPSRNFNAAYGSNTFNKNLFYGQRENALRPATATFAKSQSTFESLANTQQKSHSNAFAGGQSLPAFSSTPTTFPNFDGGGGEAEEEATDDARKSNAYGPYVDTIDYVAQSNRNDGRTYAHNLPTQTAAPHSLLYEYPNEPRYTLENGVRYENKIFWKYPDGRVSDTPPKTYVQTYTPTKHRYTEVREENTEENGPFSEGIYAQGPIQFPSSPDSDDRQQESPFVSAESLSSNLPQQQAYRIGYQSLIGQSNLALLQRAKEAATNAQQQQQQQQRQSGVTASASPPSSYSSSTTSQHSFANSPSNGSTKQKIDYSSLSSTSPRPFSRYMVNGPNPEYVDHRSPSSFSTSHSADSQSAYDFDEPSNGANDYSDLRYTDLLNYNPSISQYIKDPSSILSVQPTFVRAGKSLIPVIILKVDGSPPYQQKSTPNINLKALLRQYLTQYADSVKELARPTNYELGSEQFAKTQSTIETGNRLLKLAKLTRGDSTDGAASNYRSYAAKRENEKSARDSAEKEERSKSDAKFGARTTVRPKTKNVEIVYDPRFTNYKIKN